MNAHDKHLGIQFLSAGVPPTPQDLTPSPEEVQQQRVAGKEGNYGFKSFRYHDGKVAHIDRCHNFGSEPYAVAFLASYLFDLPTPPPDILVAQKPSYTRCHGRRHLQPVHTAENTSTLEARRL